MKVPVRTLACAVLVAAAAMMLIGCGGKQTMASKSAAAYDEAKRRGIPIEAGEHGGHSVEGAAAQTAAQASMPGMEQPAMHGMQHETSAVTHEMAGMNHSAMGEMDHAKMPAMQQKTAAMTHDMAGMNDSTMTTMPGMKHGAAAGGTHDMAGMSHSAMAGMDHAMMPGMQHGATAAPAMVINPPSTNSAIAQTQPATTLRADAFDAPAASSVGEAAKASSTEHEQHAPQPPSQHREHGNGEGS
jgi:hypothetical protein